MADVTPLNAPIEPPENDTRLEIALMAVEGREPANAKRILIQMGMGNDPILNPQQVNLALGALGLEAV